MTNNTTLFGFWVYLMTDCILFMTLFVTYVVLHHGTYGGPSSMQLFDLPFALTETFVLLTSSFLCGIAMIPSQLQDKRKIALWFGLTFLLGLTFIIMEIKEFHHFIHIGSGWERSAFLSSYFTLVGTHGVHVSLGLLWMIVLLVPVFRRGMNPVSLRRLTCLSLFWHFLDVVWIFIFTVVYLMGVV